MDEQAHNARAAVEHLRELLSQRMDMMDTAMAQAAKEVARRLDELNHAAARQEMRDRDYVNREVFERRTEQVDTLMAAAAREILIARDAHEKADAVVHAMLTQRLEEMERWRASQAGAAAAMQRIAAVTSALIGAAVSAIIAAYVRYG